MRVGTLRFDLGSNEWSSELPALDSPRTIVLAFGAPELQNQQRLFQTLRNQYPNSHLLGCSTAGEIFDGHLYDGSLSVAVVQFEQIDVGSAALVVRRPEQAFDAGRELARRLQHPGHQLTGVVLLADGVGLDQRGLVRGVYEELGQNIPIVGALAGDAQRFERTWVLTGDRIQSGLCAAAGLYGSGLVMNAGVTEDWTESPPAQHVVNKSEGHTVLELDGQPAAQLCQGPNGLRPLRMLHDDGGYVHFAPLRKADDSSGVVYHQLVPEGARVQLLDPDTGSLIRGAASAASSVEGTVNSLISSGADTLMLALSGVGRRMFLEDRAADEIYSLTSSIPPRTPLVGLYSYGELSPGPTPAAGFRESSLSVVVLSEMPYQPAMPAHDSGSLPPGGPQVPAAAPAASAQPALSEPTASSPGLAHHPGAQSDGFEEYSPSMQSYSAAAQSYGTGLREVRPQIHELGSVKATIYNLGALRYILLEGTLNEHFNAQGLAPELRGRVVLDVGGIEHVTSFGVRAWLEMMTTADPMLSELYLANCSEAIVNQMLMVRNFAGKGIIVSFGAPYICTSCSNSFEFVLDTQHSAPEINEASLPDVACPDCGNRSLFDDDPTTYFEFLDPKSTGVLPPDVRNALAERRLEWMTHVDEAIEKQVQGNVTVFRINKKLDEKIRWKRVLQGIEGTVRFDFTRCKSAEQIGAERFLASLRIAGEGAEELLFDQVPLQVVETLTTAEPIANLRIRTISVPARCTNCGVVRQASIDPPSLREAMRQNLQPESECRRCSGSIPIALPSPVVAYLRGTSPESSAQWPARTSMLLIGGAVIAIAAITVAVIAFL